MSARAKALRNRRTRPSLVVRVRALWLIGLLVLCVLVVAGFAIVNAPQLRVRSVAAIVPAGSPVTKDAVVAAARIDADANLWLLNTGAIRARLNALPYVATAAVHRAQFPKPNVLLEITLRRPTGCVRAGTDVMTIDATARVLQSGCVSPILPMVDAGTAAGVEPGKILAADDVNRLLADAKAIGDHIPVRIVRRDRFGGLEAVDSRGVTLKFGADSDLAAKVALVEPIRASAAHGTPLRTIDLRAPRTPVVEYP